MGKKSDELAGQIKAILNRLTVIEARILQSSGKHDELADDSKGIESCGLPHVPPRQLEAGIDPDRKSLIRSIEKKWVNGTKLNYYFFTNDEWAGNQGQQQIVRDAFEQWKQVGIGLQFNEVSQVEDADIRIGFKRGDGSWSYVGRDIWSIAADKRTMNFGWKLSGQSGRDTALHEIGHTLGFHHEQQNPFAGIQWDEQAVYRYFMGPPNNWSRQKTFNNVMRTLEANSVEGSTWDPDSIMQYAIRSGLIVEPERYRGGLRPQPGLSDQDKERVRSFYPEEEREYEPLARFESKRLKLASAEQVNFSLNPPITGSYNIQTFGAADTLMVLFEDNGGSLEHLAADDDSGFNRNASLKVRLVRGRSYVLRLRLYTSNESGEFGLMYW